MVTSFLFGLLRLGFLSADLVTLLMSCACLILRLSFFEEAKRVSAETLLAFEGFLSMDFKGRALREDDGEGRSGAWINQP